MKVLFLGLTNLKFMPYLNFYLNNIDLSKNDVSVAYWSRRNTDDVKLDSRIKTYSYNEKMSDSINVIKKLPFMFRYGTFAKKVIKETSPDLIIVSYPQTAIFILSTLLTKYKNRYVLDYRDVTYEERFKPYGRFVKMLSQKARVTFTSSDGFKRFLSENVHTVHNINKNELKEWTSNEICHNSDKPIRICFWGLIRHYEINRQIIEQIGNDSRFELHYYGQFGNSFKEIVEETKTKYNNIFFHGEYNPSDRIMFSKQCDIIHNIYNIQDTIPYAMGNKYYDGLMFKKPQLFMNGSYMAEINKKSNVGLNCNPFDSDFKKKIIDYYLSIDKEAFSERCSIELDRICKENSESERVLKEIITNY